MTWLRYNLHRSTNKIFKILTLCIYDNILFSFRNIQAIAPVAVIFVTGLQFTTNPSFVFNLGIPSTTQISLSITVSNGSQISSAMFTIIYGQGTYLDGGMIEMTALTNVQLLTIDGQIKLYGQGLSGFYTTSTDHGIRIRSIVIFSASSYSVQYTSWNTTTLFNSIVNYQISYFGYKPCAKYCVSCLTTGPTYCTACIASTQRNTDPLCTTCNYGYYMPSNEQGCISCSSNCDGCLSPTGDCLNCLASTLRINPPLCTDCQSNYYAQIGNIICQQCSSNCYECVTTSTQCTTCYPLSYRSVDTNLKCSCMTGYFEQDNQCQQCDVSCQACSGPYFECTMCQQTCNQCQVGRCQCDKGYYINVFHECESFCGDQIVVGNEQCDDGNQDPFDGCFQCQYTCNAHCDVCANNICMNCQSGYYLSTINQCESICGDGIIAAYEQCDDQLLIDYIQCYNCKLICDINCIECRYGRCIQCQIGYSINNFNQCQTICGDLIVLGQEQCDDGNLIPQNGCWNCQFDCPINCYTCTLGQCTECNSGYYTQYSNKCNSFCGDGIIAGNELCDDGNSIFFDGCYTCNWSCIDHCLTCFNGVCQNCQSGYYLFNQQCYSICGDNIVTNDEFCDDGNSYPFDNCHQCQRSCSQYCLNCSDGFCLSCQNGYYVNDNLCTTQCGDMIIAGSEQCDDGNSDIYDGCDNCIIGCPYATFLLNNTCKYNCGDGLLAKDLEQCDDGNRINNDGCSNCIIDKNYVCDHNVPTRSVCYLCPFNCSSCSKGICSDCNKSYFINQGLCIQCDQSCVTCKDYPTNCIQFVLPNTTTCNVKNDLYPNQITGQCYSICGDSIKAESEQCDDGNILSGDGCNSLCQIESGWYCDSSNPNNCEIKDVVNLILESIQPHNGSYEIKVGLSQNCAINKAQLIGIDLKFSIANLHYNNISLFLEDYQNYQDISYLITIIPLQNIDILHLNISTQNQGFISKQGFILAQRSLQLDLFDLQYISTEQTDALNKITLFNNYIIYAMIAVGVSSLLAGSFEPVLNMLDLMQYISYLQWIDIYFPYLLEEYLNIFNVVSLDLILEQLKMTSSDTYPYYPTSYKLNYYDVNAYLIANLQSFFVTLIQTYAIYSFIIITSARFINRPLSSSYCKLTLQFIISRLYRSSLKMHFSGFVQMIVTSYYDLAICLCLYIFYPSIKSDIDSMYIILSLLVIFTLLHTLYESTIINKRKMVSSLRTGIITKTIYQMQYSQCSLVKKIVFCIIIVGFQESGIIQAILISMNSITFALYLIINKPLKDSSENFKILSVEIMVSLQSLSFIGYELIQNQIILLYLQWINIGIFSLNICLCLIIDFRKTAKSRCKQIKLIYYKCVDHQNQHRNLGL